MYDASLMQLQNRRYMEEEEEEEQCRPERRQALRPLRLLTTWATVGFPQGVRTDEKRA